PVFSHQDDVFYSDAKLLLSYVDAGFDRQYNSRLERLISTDIMHAHSDVVSDTVRPVLAVTRGVDDVSCRLTAIVKGRTRLHSGDSGFLLGQNHLIYFALFVGKMAADWKSSGYIGSIISIIRREIENDDIAILH